MAKFYWMKLKEDFFDDDTIRYIEEQERGVYYINFYLKLCLKSMKNNGKLIRLVGETLIPYDAKSLARLTNTDYDTVITAMKLFEQIGLITFMESGEIFLNQMAELTGGETDKARLMREKRAKDKLISASNDEDLEDEELESNDNSDESNTVGNNVTEKLPKSYIEIRDKEIRDRDKEIEIRDKDKEKEKEGDEAEPHRAPINYAHIVEQYNSICKSLPAVKNISQARKKAIRARLNSYSEAQLISAFRKSQESDFLRGKNNRNWRADLDWILKDTNIAKILDGKYDNKGDLRYGEQPKPEYDFSQYEV